MSEKEKDGLHINGNGVLDGDGNLLKNFDSTNMEKNLSNKNMNDKIDFNEDSGAELGHFLDFYIE